jgi:hypothetical protein
MRDLVEAELMGAVGRLLNYYSPSISASGKMGSKGTSAVQAVPVDYSQITKDLCRG